MMYSNRDIGMWGESKAVEYLLSKGYVIKDRNVYTTYGEIDIVACKGKVTCFVEVKTRRNANFGLPEDSITTQKKNRLIESAIAYLVNNPELGDQWQIDVIAIEQIRGDKLKINHFKNAIIDCE